MAWHFFVEENDSILPPPPLLPAPPTAVAASKGGAEDETRRRRGAALLPLRANNNTRKEEKRRNRIEDDLKKNVVDVKDKENVKYSQKGCEAKEKSHLQPSKAFTTYKPPTALTPPLNNESLDIAHLFVSNLPVCSNMGYFCYIFRYIFSRQFELQPKINFMSRQTDINMSMRFKLVDWIIEVVDELKMRRDTLFTCINVIDRFLSKMAVLRGKLQLVGTTALLICSKFEEIHPPELKIFSYITENSYTDEEILRMENIIVRALKFDICIPTIATFIDFLLFCSQLDKDTKLKNFANYIGELVLLDPLSYFNCHPPALIAFAIVTFSLHTLSMHPWPQIVSNLAESVTIKFLDLLPCLIHIYKTLLSAEKAKNSIYLKYKSAIYASVSIIALPKNLPILYPVAS